MGGNQSINPYTGNGILLIMLSNGLKRTNSAYSRLKSKSSAEKKHLEKLQIIKEIAFQVKGLSPRKITGKSGFHW